MKFKDILKIAAPVVLGPVAGSAVSSFLPAAIASNPMIRSALVSGIGSLAFGGKPKDALRSALLGGIGGAMFPGQEAMQGTNASQNAVQLAGQNKNMGAAANQLAGATPPPAGTGTAQGIGSVFGRGIAPGAEAKTMSGELLKSLKFAGEQEDGNLLFKLLNTQMGEGLAAGLVAQLLAGGDEEDGPAPGSYESRPFGGGYGGGQLGGIRYAEGGLADAPDYYPRRNGGIDPSEGSGTEDDVPALLMAGEFVMTKDAVEGAGGGDVRKGIKNMYTMMDQFERMA
tara:strand:- start:1102 stop:1953 length:852 start_codon:yes stop_codon:yes gene_type:complete